MRLLVVVVGKDQKDPLKEAALEYLRRTHSRLKTETVNIRESKRRDNSELASEEEGKEILRVTDKCYRIALDVKGKHLSSPALAHEIQKLLVEQKQPLALIIGGASGLSQSVLKACQAKWSLSELTLPHRLAFLVLCEQIYRAGEILRGGPYHK